MLNDYQMQQHVNSAYHEHGNIIDLVITHQRDSIVSNINVMDHEMSHHYCVECNLNVFIKPGKARFEQKRAVKHIQMGVFVNDIKVNITQMKTGDLSVDKMLHTFNNILSITLNKHASLKKHVSKHNYIPGIMRISKMLVCIDVYGSVFGDILDYIVPG